MKDEIRKLLTDALVEISPTLPDKVPQYSDDLILLSNMGGIFDSLSLFSFVGIVENMISDTMKKNITIMSEKVFLQENSPFKSMETFGAFIEELLKAE